MEKQKRMGLRKKQQPQPKRMDRGRDRLRADFIFVRGLQISFFVLFIVVSASKILDWVYPDDGYTSGMLLFQVGMVLIIHMLLHAREMSQEQRDW